MSLRHKYGHCIDEGIVTPLKICPFGLTEKFNQILHLRYIVFAMFHLQLQRMETNPDPQLQLRQAWKV